MVTALAASGYGITALASAPFAAQAVGTYYSISPF